MIRRNATKLKTQMLKVKTNVVIIFFLVFLLSMAFGCARTVTQVLDFGTQMGVSVKFREKIDVTNNRYFMVLSTSESFSIALPPPDSMDEFLEPGDLPQTGSIADYYTDYYSTWSGYIVVDETGYYINKGPFFIGDSTTREVLSTLPELTDTISFNFRLSQIFGSTIPDTIYFDIICANYPNGAEKFLKDHIAPPVRTISKVSGSLASGSVAENTVLSGSQDIINWAVEVQ